MRVIKYLLLLILVVLLAGAGHVGWLFYRSLPTYVGQVEMPDLSSPVRVYRDEHGVPHIFASNMFDAARTLGYIHADERLFQMEMNRRAGAGRLSEVLGADTLDIDKFTRTMGFYRLAQSTYETLTPDAQKLMDAYCAGVNIWLTEHKHKMPPEFVVLGIKPEPWKPADSLVWARLMALQLSENYKREVLRAKLAGKLQPAEIETLFAHQTTDAPVTTQPKYQQNGENKIDVLDRLGKITGLDQAASNEWVVSGTRTESGKPILANDPHLGLEAPILWYLARITTPDLELEGATVPGLPVVLLGQNHHIAWGLTTTGSDVQDLFIETIDPNNPLHYLAPGSSQPFETRDEIIHVKSADDVNLKVRSTRHGPVLSDIDDDLAKLAGDGKVMALSFTALTEEDATPEALMRMNRATNWQEFLAALTLYKAPPQNIVYADTAGNIGFVGAGVVPIRRSGKGLVPAEGRTNEFDWMGMIPFEHWPQIYNPPAGYAFNANNAIVPADSTDYYGVDWEEPFRAERLQELFDATPKHSLDTSAKMQADITSVAAKQLLPYLLREKFYSVRETQAQDLLSKWDFTMDKDRVEPLIFEAWLYEMHKLMFTDKVGDNLKAIGPYDAQAILTILADPATKWCDTPKEPDPNCSATVRHAFEEAQALLTNRDGADMSKWRWGDEHITVLRHKFYDHIPGFKDLAKLDVKSSGSYYTLDRGGSSSTDPEHPFARTHGGGYRGLYDLGDPNKSRFMIATGQSGHVLTQHWGNLVEPWNDIQSFTLTGSEDELKARGLPLLTFSP
jgi:penicillin G amidase